MIPDTDEDGIWDVWEAYYRYYCRSSKDYNISKLADYFSPTDTYGADKDADEDGLVNTLEFLNPVDFDGRLSTNPLDNDTDDDGVGHGLEITATPLYRVYNYPTLEVLIVR